MDGNVQLIIFFTAKFIIPSRWKWFLSSQSYQTHQLGKVKLMDFVNTKNFNCITPTVLNVEWLRTEILQII
jgi:hypothetical protein